MPKKPKLTIYVFGNPLLPEDSLPLRLLPALKKACPQINFRAADPTENLKPTNGQLVIIDTVLGANDIVLIDDLDKIQLAPIYSAHDLDLGFNLKLLAKLGQLEKVIIFGLPPKMPKQTALKKLIKLLNNLNFV